MNNKITFDFINEIKKKSAPSTLNAVQEILPLNREAIYRRLTNKVAFTYVEAVRIAQKLKISLDHINNISIGGHLFQIDNPVNFLTEEGYIKSLIYNDILLYEYLNEDNAYFYSVQSTIPRVFLLNYKSLARLKYYKWIYENTKISISKQNIDTILLSENSNLKKEEDAIIQVLRNVNSQFILTDMIFKNIIKDIKYFIELGLINSDELVVLKKDLLSLIDEFEDTVSLGHINNGGNFSVYLSEIHIDSNFGLIHSDSSQLVFNKLCGMNYGLSNSHEIFEIYKQSFNQLKSYTTLISQTSSSKRISFFNKQRGLIEKSL